MSLWDLITKAKMQAEAALIAKHGMHIGGRIHHRYRIECVRNGRVAWVEEFTNLVTTAGMNQYLDAALKTGLASPAWYVLLKNTGTANAADTLSSHAGWTENQGYSNATRVQWTPGNVSAGSVDNSASPAALAINANGTIFGAGLCSQSNKASNTGTLLGVGDFAANRAVISGDTLNVTVTCSLS